MCDRGESIPLDDSTRHRLLVKVSTLYYLDNLGQQEIAARLGISRPQVSRLLTTAHNSGIVEIRIRSPLPDHSTLERELEQAYGLRQAMVVGPDATDPAENLTAVARAAAGLLAAILRDGDTLGVMSGTTLSAVAAALEPAVPRRVTVVPMIGGEGPPGELRHANETAQGIAARLGGRYFLLNAPAVVGTADSRAVFVAEAGIRQVLDLAASSDVALLGIGTASPASTAVRAGFLTSSDLQSIASQGAVGHIGTGFFTLEGETLKTGLSDRFIGLSLVQIKRIPRRIGVATGVEKAPAIAGALRGGFVNTLVTSEATARSLLSFSQ